MARNNLIIQACSFSLHLRVAQIIFYKKNFKYYYSATAITEAEVCFIDIDKFGKLLELNGKFATEVITYIFNDEMNYFDRLVNNVQQQNLVGWQGLV